MIENGLNQADIIRKTGAGRATVSGWISGTNTPSAKYIDILATTLKTDSTWLLTGRNSHNSNRCRNDISSNNVNKVTYVPVLSWAQAGSLSNFDTFNDIENCEMLPLIPGASTKSFFLIVKGLSNAPYFDEGEKICIDPDYLLEDIQTGEMIVVKCDDEISFRALVVEPNGFYLKSLNSTWSEQIIKLKDNCTVIGKYVGSFRPAKKFNLIQVV